MNGPTRMVLMVATLFFAFKAMTLPRRNVLGYLFLWPGMDPQPFNAMPRRDLSSWKLIIRGMIEAEAGVAVLIAALFVDGPVRVWIAGFGAILMLHIGIFDFLSGAWRSFGVPVERICPSPWRAASLSEFWSMRWNRAFHVIVRDKLHRPLRRRVGKIAAIAIVFLVSGILHELVISWPARGGWGLPTLYFAIHGAAVLLERRGFVFGRLGTALLVLAPLPLLFHGPFRTNVLLPLVTP